jgi:CIC family chloride channel protein
LLRKYLSLIHEDLTAVYARDLRKWLIVAPVIGLTTGLVITGVVVIIVGKLWPPVLNYYLHHHSSLGHCRGIGSGIHRYRDSSCSF